MIETFADRWKERLKLPKRAWKSALRQRLREVPFSEPERTLPLFHYLLETLPKRLKKRPAERYRKCAESYGWFCLAVLSGESIYVQYAENFAFYLKTVLESDEVPPAAEVIADLYRPNYPNQARDRACGSNQLEPARPEILREAEQLMATGEYEDFLTTKGKQKYEEYRCRLEDSEVFHEEWELIKVTFPQATETGIVRRSLLQERNWQTGFGAAFDDEAEAFQSVFDLFCWKWYLWGMAGDMPLLLKPSVNVTAYGTQLFIPGYLSFDSKRDIKTGKISKLHHARGNVPKQGSAFTESREQFAEMSKKARAAERVGRKQGLKGGALEDFVLKQIGRPQADPRQLRRWLG